MSCFFGSRMDGYFAFSAPMISAASSTDSVVCVTNAIRSGSASCSACVLDVFDEMHALARLAHRAFHFRMALVADHHDVEAVWRIFATSMCTLVTSGQVASY